MDSTDRQKLDLFTHAFTQAREGIFITNSENQIVDANNSFTTITGYTREEVLGKNPKFLHSGKHNAKFYAQMWKSLSEKGYWNGEIANRRKNGEAFVEMLSISTILDEKGRIKNYIAFFVDVSTLKEHQRALEHFAHYDVLTNLPNRLLFADRLSQALRNTQRNKLRVAVAFIDIDGFKQINDTHGHNMGDDLLVELSKRMKEVLREGDTLARVGGDEFLVILLVDHPNDYHPILDRLLLAASDTIVLNGVDLNVSASIGLSVSAAATDNVEADQLIRQADQAMYLAKQSGKNCYHVFKEEEDSAIHTLREKIHHIQLALQNDELRLYYQPKVNMALGEVVGVEALMRWEHPQKGLLSPHSFLPIIQDHTLSIELGEWVIDTALSQIANWQSVGCEISVSVNINALQLQQKNFASRLEALLNAHPNVSPHLLELEVLETSAIGDIALVSSTMQSCIDLGVQFTLDDFGTGYSSLTYLRRLPAKNIKIDQTFVRDMLIDPDDLSIVEGVIGLAKAFGRKVIAEGVETIEHGRTLLHIGCETAQGYAIAKAMEAEAIPGWIKSWQPDTVWRTFTPNENDFRVNAELDHNHWLKALQAYLHGHKETPPPMDSDKCHFGHWIDKEGTEQYDHHPEFDGLISVHEKVHALGRELVSLFKEGHHEEVRLREPELLALYNAQAKKTKEILMVWQPKAYKP